MHAWRGGRRQPLLFAAAVDRHAVEVTLGSIVGRRKIVDPAVLNIDSLHGDHVVVAGRDGFDVLAVAGDRVNVPPAVAFAGPQETLAAVNPFDVATPDSRLVPTDITPGDVDPGVVLLGQY